MRQLEEDRERRPQRRKTPGGLIAVAVIVAAIIVGGIILTVHLHGVAREDRAIAAVAKAMKKIADDQEMADYDRAADGLINIILMEQGLGLDDINEKVRKLAIQCVRDDGLDEGIIEAINRRVDAEQAEQGRRQARP